MAEVQRQVSTEWLLETANREMYRLKYSASLVDQHCKELRDFRNYCRQNAISFYDSGTGIKYFAQRYGISVTDTSARFTPAQKKTRTTLRFLDDIYTFGYAKRYRNCEYMIPPESAKLLEDYLCYCIRNNGAAGTIRVKKTKLLQFLCFLDRKQIDLRNVTASVISDWLKSGNGVMENFRVGQAAFQRGLESLQHSITPLPDYSLRIICPLFSNTGGRLFTRSAAF